MRSLPYAEDRNRGRSRLLRERTHFQVHPASNDREIPDPERLYILSQRQDDCVGNRRDESLVAAIPMDTSVTVMRRLSGGPAEEVSAAESNRQFNCFCPRTSPASTWVVNLPPALLRSHRVLGQYASQIQRQHLFEFSHNQDFPFGICFPIECHHAFDYLERYLCSKERLFL